MAGPQMETRRARTRAPAGLIPVARPRLPPARALLPYLRRIDQAAWYSNHGPLAQSFQARLAEHWGVEAGHVALLSSATSAITLALLARGARTGRRCLMPSWTFAASAGAVVQAGLVPHFVDVVTGTGVPDPDEVQALARAGDVGAILVVSPFGAPLDLPAWAEVERRTGVPVVIDGAAAFDTLRDGGPMQAGACPVAVSLHATKVFGVGEGGALLCRDAQTMDRVRRLSQFGFLGTRAALLPGMNAKLSEYAAAVGLAGLDAWPETRARWHVAARRYRDRLPDGVSLPAGFGVSWVSSTLSLACPGPPTETALRARGIETLCWWGPGCHAQPAYRGCAAEPLPVTAELARHTLGLPFWQDIPAEQIERVCEALADCLAPSRQAVAA